MRRSRRDDHDSLGLVKERAFVETTPEMFDMKRGIPETGNLIARPGAHDGFRFGDLRPLFVSIPRIPDRIGGRFPRFFDSELRRFRNRAPCRPSWWAMQPFQNDVSTRRQMMCDPL